MADVDIASPPAAPQRDEELWELEALGSARRLCDWRYEQFADRVRGDVAEVGAGIGTFTERLLSSGARRVLLIEPHGPSADVLEHRYGRDPRVLLAREELPDAPTARREAGRFDFVLCQNVLEHIPDDAGSLRAMGDLLRPGGHLGLLVPAHPRLYNELDRRFAHCRRYSRPVLRELIERAGLDLEELYHFDPLGIPGWVVKGRSGDARISPGSLRAYEAMLSVWRPIERRIRMPAGLSLIAQIRKPS